MTPKKFLIGLTGSIGMGKSTTAKMFLRRGVPVWDADAAVARLYQKGGSAVEPVRAVFPDAIVAGAVNKDALKREIHKDPAALEKLEMIVHPLVRQDRDAFVANASEPILVLDIPLLFEGGGQKEFDLVVVVSSPANIQRERVLARPGMTEDQFSLILSKQMPDDQKRALADVVIETTTIEGAETAVDDLLKMVENRLRHA